MVQDKTTHSIIFGQHVFALMNKSKILSERKRKVWIWVEIREGERYNENTLYKILEELIRINIKCFPITIWLFLSISSFIHKVLNIQHMCITDILTQNPVNIRTVKYSFHWLFWALKSWNMTCKIEIWYIYVYTYLTFKNTMKNIDMIW